MRLIDADALKEYIDCGHLRDPGELCFSEIDVVELIDTQQTVDAVPVEYLQRIAELYEDGQFVCDFMTDNGGVYCDEHCNYSYAQGECIRHYLELTAERRGEAS